jgi:superfamily II DNA/RNA helicase
LYDHIAEWAKKELNIYSAQIVGGNNANKTNLISSKSDFNHILINFSPISKNRGQILTDIHEEIDILICTDCISEGQNLQDCDFLVNYDIHWNPVRIIQRFGRIDRIGSKNDKIQLVNFFPNLELDTYIDLIARVKGRMQILDVSATGDDNIIEEQNDGLGDLEYRKRQLKSMQSKVLDLEDIEGGISITDLTFNDFKIDIERLSNEEKFKFENDQKSLFSIVKNNLEEVPNGVVFCFKTLKETKNNNNYNALYPYFLCYISENQEVFLTLNYSKKSLDVYKKLCYGQTELLSTLFEMFNKETNNSKNMNKYKELLNIALTHIKGEEDEYGIDTLASPGGTKINKEINKDYELVSYLIVK